jgi:hypothetical protein
MQAKGKRKSEIALESLLLIVCPSLSLSLPPPSLFSLKIRDTQRILDGNEANQTFDTLAFRSPLKVVILEINRQK